MTARTRPTRSTSPTVWVGALVTGTVHIAQRAVTTDPVHRWFSDGVVLAMDTDVIVGHRASA